MGLGVGLVAVVGLLATGVSAQTSLGAAAERAAVVPFDNISGRSEDAWLGAGIAETVAAGLSGSGTGLRSVARVPDVAAGERLGVRWVISGSYQRLGDQLRATARVIDVAVATGMVVGTVTVDGTLEGFFALQDRLVSGLMPVLVGMVSGEAVPDRARPRPVESPIGGTERVVLVPRVIDGPAPPVAPAVINRDAEGRATIRAARVTEEINLDGQLDESVYQTVPALTEFIQQSPDAGTSATEETEAWILFNEENLYVAGRIWDSAPPNQWVANEMRRDTAQLRQNDTFAVVLDTFYDRRNGVAFYTNALGAIADFALTNESNPNSDWNPVWDVQTDRFDGGWTVEMEIPFRSLRYRPGPDQVWGVQLRRNVRRKNEWAYLTPLPISIGSGPGGIFRVSDAATLVGFEVPEASKNLELKPYGIGGLSTNLSATPPTRNTGDGNAGIDVKYGITQNLTADFTYNTDFAQVEVDEQQVNLTRFSLFFPEKREFFLEGRGIFGFARGTRIGGGSRGGLRRAGGGSPFGGGNVPTLFYSRKIGLQRGTVVPIVGGGRVTGKIGAFDVGFLNIHTDDNAAADAAMTNFTVARM